MRNEGPFIVEWVTWYRMLGFTDVVVVTNNCTDHSPDLLDALQTAGWLVHLRHDVEPGQRITRAKLKVAAGHRAVRRAQWVMVCDVDEFLVIHRGAGLIGDLIDFSSAEPPFLGMSINWRIFGSSGLSAFEDRPVHQQFVYANPRTAPQSRFAKAIFRLPRLFSQIGEHGPTGFDFERAGKPWRAPGMIWVNAAGRPVPRWRPVESFPSRLPAKLVTYQVAQINHYMVRSEESFSLKRGTLSPVALSNRYRKSYFDSANAGDEVDASAFRYAEAFSAMHEQAMALPDVARLHALCCADHIQAICEKAGKRAEDDARYQAFMEQAAVRMA
jgi:hypothetical protein